jgi:hypothetical protein
VNDTTLMEVANHLHVVGVEKAEGIMHEIDRGVVCEGGDADFAWRIYREDDALLREGEAVRHVLTWTDGVCGQWATLAAAGEDQARFFLDLLTVVCKHELHLDAVRAFADAPGCGG